MTCRSGACLNPTPNAVILIVVFKTPHTPLTRKLGIQSEFSKLKRDLSLQCIMGNEVLRNVKAVVANPVDKCLFRDTDGMNFPIDTFPSS